MQETKMISSWSRRRSILRGPMSVSGQVLELFEARFAVQYARPSTGRRTLFTEAFHILPPAIEAVAEALHL
jgi:hypothetical protein